MKDITPALAWVWEERARGSRDFEIVSRMFTSLVKTQDLLHDHRDEHLLPIDVAAQVFDLTKQFLLDYQRLAAAAEARGDCLWSMPTKFHWLYPWAERSRWLNPRKGNCMIDEDFVGKCKILAPSCAATAPGEPQQVPGLPKS